MYTTYKLRLVDICTALIIIVLQLNHAKINK